MMMMDSIIRLRSFNACPASKEAGFLFIAGLALIKLFDIGVRKDSVLNR